MLLTNMKVLMYVINMLVDLVQLVSVTDISGITEWVSDNLS
uniref:Uncharacterized protein n=1 Tax=Anguilla anguilla TaxID=7936 RepID=A0A0E9R7S0_ANGAN